MDGAARATPARQLPLEQLKLIPSLCQTPPANATRPLAIERRSPAFLSPAAAEPTSTTIYRGPELVQSPKEPQAIPLMLP